VVTVHGGSGIARRIAWLTRGQDWPEQRPPGRVLFTGGHPASLERALAAFGLDEILST
jgi:glutamate racemase